MQEGSERHREEGERGEQHLSGMSETGCKSCRGGARQPLQPKKKLGKVHHAKQAHGALI